MSNKKLNVTAKKVEKALLSEEQEDFHNSTG
jgi:hypothetical protein